MSEPKRFTAAPPLDVRPEDGIYTFPPLDEKARKQLNFNRTNGLLSYSKLCKHDDPDRKISAYVAGVGELVSDALLFGRAALSVKYEFLPENVLFNTREGKAEKARLERLFPGKILVRPKEAEEAGRLCESALANAAVRDAMSVAGYCEAGIIAPVDGVRFRAWADKLTSKFCLDLKTSRAANEGEFLDSVVKYGYDAQAALYLDMLAGLGLSNLRFAWVVLSKTSCNAWVQELPPWAYWTGRRWRESVIRSYKRENMIRAAVEDVAGTREVSE